MNTIEIKNNIIHYISNYQTMHKDKSWTLDISCIKVIGFINRMDGDDDSDFIVLVDKNLKKYFITITKRIKGFEILTKHLTKIFKIEINKSDTGIIDDEKIVFPKCLSRVSLYKKSLRKKIRLLVSVDHVADGELSQEVINHLKMKS